MSRRTKTHLPTAETLLKPELQHDVGTKIEIKHRKSQQNYDRSAKELPILRIGDMVRVQPSPGSAERLWKRGHCIKQTGARSYIIDIEGRAYQRNRKHIIKRNETVPSTTTFNETSIGRNNNNQQYSQVPTRKSTTNHNPPSPEKSAILQSPTNRNQAKTQPTAEETRTHTSTANQKQPRGKDDTFEGDLSDVTAKQVTEIQDGASPARAGNTTTRSGRVIRAPPRMSDFVSD
jgi:hypothetical protein